MKQLDRSLRVVLACPKASKMHMTYRKRGPFIELSFVFCFYIKLENNSKDMENIPLSKTFPIVHITPCWMFEVPLLQQTTVVSLCVVSLVQFQLPGVNHGSKILNGAQPVWLSG